MLSPRRCLQVGLLTGIALLVSGAAPPQEPAPAGDGPPQPSDLAAKARQLRSYVPKDEIETTVPPAVRTLLTAWKAQIRERIGRELQGFPRDAPAKRVREALLGALARAGVPVGEEPRREDGPYGWLDAVDVLRPEGHPRLLAVTVRQLIQCGADSALYLFAHDGREWRLAFALESNDYEEVRGALGSFDFRLSPPDREGRFFLLATDINPWCVSNWQGLRYRTYRLGGNPLQPVPFFSQDEGVFLGREVELSVTVDGFRVAFAGSQRLDTGILVRDYVRAFRVTGTKVERIGPLATEPNGFVDEWIAQPWEVAARWSAPAERGALRVWHRRLQERAADLSPGLEPVKACGPARSQVTLAFDEPDPHQHPLPERVFFTLLRQGDDFRMERIDVVERKDCGAPARAQLSLPAVR